MTATTENYIHGENKSRLNRRNKCCHSVQNFTWSLILRKDHHLEVFEDNVMVRMLETKERGSNQGRKQLHSECHNLCPSANIISD
jgi:hypothetical protein